MRLLIVPIVAMTLWSMESLGTTPIDLIYKLKSVRTQAGFQALCEGPDFIKKN